MGLPSTHGVAGDGWSSPAITAERTGPGRRSTRQLPHVNSNNLNIITLVESKSRDKVRYGPYGTTGYAQFLDHEGYPAIKPPWGTLTAINLNSGEFAWQVPLGEHAKN